MKHEKTYRIDPSGILCGYRHCAQISFIMHCIGELIDPTAKWLVFKCGCNTVLWACATAAPGGRCA